MNLSFLAPQFLYLLPTLAIPLILHLISRNKSIDLVFPSIRFLKIGQVPKQQKKRIKDIILLLLRTLLILLLITILAHPQIINNQKFENKRKQVVVIDAGLIRFHTEYYDQLKKALEQIQTNANSNDMKIMVVSSIQTETFSKIDIPQVINKIKSFKPDYKEPNFTSAFNQAQKFLNSGESILSLITNLRRKNFQTIPLKPFSKNVTAQLINLPLSKNNIGIIDVQVVPVEEFKKFRLTCTVLNESDKNQMIKLTINGYNEQINKDVVLANNAPTRVLFEINASENHDFYISHNFNDTYMLDNIRYFKTPNKKIIKGLLVYDQSNYTSDKSFLEEALKINNEILTPIELKQFEVSSADWSTLEKPQFIFILGCAAKLNNNQNQLIKEMLHHGTVLFNTPGELYKENINALNSNGFILQSSGPLVKSEYLSEPYFIESYNTESNLLKIFDNDPKALFSVTIKKYIKLFTHGAAETLITTHNRTPLLALNRIGKGLSFVFSINLNLEWSDLPVSTVFVPLFRELIQNSIASTENKPYEIEAGDLISSPEIELTYFNHMQTKKVKSHSTSQITISEPGIYNDNQKAWVANPQPLQLDGNTISAYEFQEKLIDKNRNIIDINDSEVFDPSPYFAMLILFLFVSEIIFMKTSIKNRIPIK